MESKEDKGRKGDTVLAHLTKGEIVLPRQAAEDKDFMKTLTKYMGGNGANINSFIVGNKENSINPKTGYAEFGFFSKIWKGITSLFKAPEMPAAPAAIPAPDPAPVPTPSESSPESSEQERRKRLSQLRSGLVSTIKTSPKGITGTGANLVSAVQSGKRTLGA